MATLTQTCAACQKPLTDGVHVAAPPGPVHLACFAQPGPATMQQQPPRATTGPSMHDLVCADLQERKAFGLAKYGTTLQAGNGRDPLIDAFQEALDQACYLRQAIEERSDWAKRAADASRGWAQETKAREATEQARDTAWKERDAAVAEARRLKAQVRECPNCGEHMVGKDAAEALDAVNDGAFGKLAKELEQVRREGERLSAKVAMELQPQLEQVTAERDAAVGRADKNFADLCTTLRERDSLAARLVASEAKALDERLARPAPPPAPGACCSADAGEQHSASCSLWPAYRPARPVTVLVTRECNCGAYQADPETVAAPVCNTCGKPLRTTPEPQ